MKQVPAPRLPKSNRHVAPEKKSTVKSNGKSKIIVPDGQEELSFDHNIEPGLQDICKKYMSDPLAFVEDMFYWRKDRTFLRGVDGPLKWQLEVLEDIGYGLEEHPDIYRLAIASGKGVGKTALLAQLLIWHITTHPHSQTTMTATTGQQARDRPWREIRKWLRVSKLYDYFTVQSTKLVHRSIDTWYGSYQTWNEERPEAFQGSHEEYVCFLIDEASGVPDMILETIETGLTDTHAFIGYFSNPTRPTGRFRECFDGPNAHLWQQYQIDSRDVEIVHKDRIQEQLDAAFGDIDNSSFRVNVRGLFPLEGYDQFIPESIIKAAQTRDTMPLDIDRVVIGVDVAVFGSNKTVFVVRKGPRILEKVIYSKQDLNPTADRLMELIDKYKEEEPVVFIDVIGYGRGVYAICQRMGYKVEGVESAATYVDDQTYANIRIEIWAKAKEWLRMEGCLDPNDKTLANQLMEVRYKQQPNGKLILESKKEMEERGFPSPDEADAFVYTFTRPVSKGRRILEPSFITGPPWARMYNGVPAHLQWMAH